MPMTARLTQTQARLYRVLADQQPHVHQDLFTCLPDPEYATLHALQDHISRLRQQLPPGESIHHCTRNGPPYYILVRRSAP